MHQCDEQDFGWPLGGRAFAAIAGVLLLLGGAVAFVIGPPRKTIEVFETICVMAVDDVNIEVMPSGRVAWNQWIVPDQATLLERLAGAAAQEQQAAVKIWFRGAKRPKIADEIEATARRLGVQNVEIVQKQRRSGRRQST